MAQLRAAVMTGRRRNDRPCGSRFRAAAAILAGLALAAGLSACRAETENGTRALPTRTLAPPTPTPTAPADPATPTPTDLPGPSSLVSTTAPVNMPGLPGDLSAALQRAVDDLVASGEAARAGVRVLSLERYQWPDASLGCAGTGPAAGAPVGEADGYRILLAGPREVYAYHVAGDTLLRCAPDRLAPGLTGEPLVPDPIAAALVDRARRDWAAETSAPASQVVLTSLLSVTWPDASLGCPRTSGPYPQHETPGYRIVVRAGEREGVYHTDIQKFVRCSPDEEVLSELLRAALATPAPAPAE